MAEIESSIFVARPPEAACAFVADLRNHEQMLPSTYSDFQIVSPNPAGLNARLEFKIGLMGKEYPASTEISVYQPPGRLIERANPSNTYLSEWRFTPESGGTRVTLKTTYRPGGGLLGAMLDRVTGGRRLRTTQTAQLQRLKSLLEDEADAGDATGA